MRILWFTWKDSSHPLAGGAELINEQIAKRLVADGHEVQFIVGGFEGGVSELDRDGYKILRLGNRFSVYWLAFRAYQKGIQGMKGNQRKQGSSISLNSSDSLISLHSPERDHWDIVIEEINTIPFFSRFYASEKVVLFVHQLAREIWFYQMTFPLSLIGYLLEPLYMWLLRKSDVITVSESTKKGLIRYGYKPEKIHIISEGIEEVPLTPIPNTQPPSPDLPQKYPNPTVLALGSVRPMKRTKHIVEAFEIAKETLPDLELIIAGDMENHYGRHVRDAAARSPYKDSIQVLGKVDHSKRKELLQKSHVLAVAAIREGWGLTVTEAASQGTPAVVYDVPGLRDSVRNDQTGLITESNSPLDLAEKMIELLQDKEKYFELQKNGWRWSADITFEKCYRDFLTVISK